MDPGDEARIANPTISATLRAFVAGQRARLSARTSRRYEEVVGLLSCYLDSYGYLRLGEEERKLCDRLYSADDEDHREFTEIFGVEQILSESASSSTASWWRRSGRGSTSFASPGR